MFKRKKEKAGAQSGAAEDKDFFAAEQTPGTDESSQDLDELKDQPEWIDQADEEGQLSVDVYQDGNNIIIKSTIAGVEPEDVDISLQDDMLTIRGERKQERTVKDREYFFQECYWGTFSRSIILPVEVDIKKIDATIKNGILTIILPKLQSPSQKNIKVKDKN